MTVAATLSPCVRASAKWCTAPCGHRAEVRYEPRTLALRLRIPADPRLLHRAVEDVVSGLLQEHRYGSDDAVPYLDDAPSEDPRAALPDVRPLTDTAAALGHECESPRLERVLRILWARRASAGGLEPVPPPRQSPPPPEAGQRVRVTAPVLRMPEGNGWVWAANGHAFALRGQSGERLLELLQENTTAAPTVGDLCRQLPQSSHAGALALLRKLHALRAVDLTDDPSSEPPSDADGSAAAVGRRSRPEKEPTP